MTHGDLKEMLALYALGALEPADAGAVERHLDGCPTCLVELAELEETASELARTTTPLVPSEEVTNRILQAARSEPLRALARPAAGRAGVGARRAGLHRASRPRRLLRIAAGMAVAAVVAGLVVSEFGLRRRLDRASSMLARGRELLEFMASPSVTTVALAASGSLPAARAVVSYDRRSGNVVLVAFDLPPPPAGHVYQLWFISDGIRPGAVFSTDARGGTLLHGQSSPEPRGVPLFAVTLEPSPGAPEPTGDILLLGGPPRPRAGGDLRVPTVMHD